MELSFINCIIEERLMTSSRVKLLLFKEKAITFLKENLLILSFIK